MISEAMVGRGEKAFDYYKRINPSAREGISEQHKCEPYVYAQMIAGKDAPTHGEAKNSWLSGTAAWNYTAITQYILWHSSNIQRVEDRSAVPADWDGFTIKRKYRNVPGSYQCDESQARQQRCGISHSQWEADQGKYDPRRRRLGRSNCRSGDGVTA